MKRFDYNKHWIKRINNSGVSDYHGIRAGIISEAPKNLSYDEVENLLKKLNTRAGYYK